MAKKTTERRTWTKENVRTLKVLAQKKKRAASIAKSLKRTEGATRQKACSLGLSLDTRSRKFASLRARYRTAIDTRFNLFIALALPQPPMGQLKRQGTIGVPIASA